MNVWCMHRLWHIIDIPNYIYLYLNINTNISFVMAYLVKCQMKSIINQNLLIIVGFARRVTQHNQLTSLGGSYFAKYCIEYHITRYCLIIFLTPNWFLLRQLHTGRRQHRQNAIWRGSSDEAARFANDVSSVTPEVDTLNYLLIIKISVFSKRGKPDSTTSMGSGKSKLNDPAQSGAGNDSNNSKKCKEKMRKCEQQFMKFILKNSL